MFGSEGILGLWAFEWQESRSILQALGLMSLKAVIALGLAFVLAFVLRRRSAASRHAVWAGAFAALLLLPVLSWALPDWRLSLPSAAAALQPIALQAPATTPADAGLIQGAALASSAAAPADELGASSLSWSQALLLIWLTGVALLLLRWTAGNALLARFSRRGRPLKDADLLSQAQALGRRLGLKRDVRLRIGESRQMPLAWGVWRSTVLLPREAVDWSREQRGIVLLHELAHVRRSDALVQHVASLACAWQWFNPLAWMALRRLRQERERACDDIVLAAGTRPSQYADHLLKMARGLNAAGLRFNAGLAMARPNQFEGRLLAILDKTLLRGRASTRFLAISLAAALLLCSPLATVSLSASATKPVQERAWTESSAQGKVDGTLSFTQDGVRVQMRMKGVRIADGYRAIKSIDPGGYLEVSASGSGSERTLKVIPDGQGNLSIRYLIDGSEIDDPRAAEDMLAEALNRFHKLERMRDEASLVEQTDRHHEELVAQQQALRRALELAHEEAEYMRLDDTELQAALEHLEESLSSLGHWQEASDHERELVLDRMARAREELRMMKSSGRFELRESMIDRMLESIRALPLEFDGDAWSELTLQLDRLADRIVKGGRVSIDGDIVRFRGAQRRISIQMRLFLTEYLVSHGIEMTDALKDQMAVSALELSRQLERIEVPYQPDPDDRR